MAFFKALAFLTLAASAAASGKTTSLRTAVRNGIKTENFSTPTPQEEHSYPRVYPDTNPNELYMRNKRHTAPPKQEPVKARSAQLFPSTAHEPSGEGAKEEQNSPQVPEHVQGGEGAKDFGDLSVTSKLLKKCKRPKASGTL